MCTLFGFSQISQMELICYILYSIENRMWTTQTLERLSDSNQLDLKSVCAVYSPESTAAGHVYTPSTYRTKAQCLDYVSLNM